MKTSDMEATIIELQAILEKRKASGGEEAMAPTTKFSSSRRKRQRLYSRNGSSTGEFKDEEEEEEGEGLEGDGGEEEEEEGEEEEEDEDEDDS